MYHLDALLFVGCTGSIDERWDVLLEHVIYPSPGCGEFLTECLEKECYLLLYSYTLQLQKNPDTDPLTIINIITEWAQTIKPR